MPLDPRRATPGDRLRIPARNYNRWVEYTLAQSAGSAASGYGQNLGMTLPDLEPWTPLRKGDRTYSIHPATIEGLMCLIDGTPLDNDPAPTLTFADPDGNGDPVFQFVLCTYTVNVWGELTAPPVLSVSDSQATVGYAGDTVVLTTHKYITARKRLIPWFSTHLRASVVNGHPMTWRA